MSWQAYVDNLLASQKVDQAAIFSKAGDSVWAHSPNFNVSPAEMSELAKGFDDPSGLQAKGLHIQGVKYFLLTANDRSIYGKKGAAGVVAVRTKQTILIAHYPEGVQPGQATTVVEGLADYLISSQY